MSDQEKLEQEPDRVPTRRVAAVGLAGLLVFGAGALWAAGVLRGATGSARSDAAPRPALAGEPEVGMVFQQPFDEGIAAAHDASARRRLEGAGWVDRDAGVAHVPIDLAMDLVVRRGALQ
jgi:hypothetical protein